MRAQGPPDSLRQRQLKNMLEWPTALAGIRDSFSENRPWGPTAAAPPAPGPPTPGAASTFRPKFDLISKKQDSVRKLQL